MLAVTEAAVDVILAMVARDGLPEQGGLRVDMPTDREGDDAFHVALAPAPSEGDQVVPAGYGANVFLDPRATAYLSDKVLDVRSEGAGRVAFTVRDQG